MPRPEPKYFLLDTELTVFTGVTKRMPSAEATSPPPQRPASVETMQRWWLLQFLQAADSQGRIFTVMEDMNLRISLKAGCDCFPGFIQLDRQLLHAFMSIGGMSQRPADGDPLSLPFFPLQQLLAGGPSDRCFLARCPVGAVRPEGAPADKASNRHVVSDPPHRTPGVSRGR